MSNKEKVEGFMMQMGLSFEERGENLWLVYGEEKGLETFIVMIEYPLLVIRINVMKLPPVAAESRCALFQDLLELNATDMTHGAYGIEGDSVVLVETLEADSLDITELQASLDAIGLALVQHYPRLSEYRTRG